jgi:tight adherence protein B
MRNVFIVLAAAGMVVFLEAVFFAVRAFRRRRALEVEQRLRAMVTAESGPVLIRRTRLAASPELERWLRKIPLALRTEKLVEAADSEFTVARLWGLSAAFGAGVLVLGVAFRVDPLSILLLVALGVAAPTLTVVIAARQRSRKLSEQLPEALDMMSRALRAGHAVTTAFHMVATEMPTPISIEFARAFEEQRLGRSLDEAILHMTQRVAGNSDVKVFAVATMIQRETGGNFSEILQGIADTIRSRYRFEGKLRALTAEGRASGVLLSLMPVVFVLLLQVISPGYLNPLVDEPSGRMIIFYAFVLWVVGVVWIRRLMNIRV